MIKVVVKEGNKILHREAPAYLNDILDGFHYLVQGVDDFYVDCIIQMSEAGARNALHPVTHEEMDGSTVRYAQDTYRVCVYGHGYSNFRVSTVLAHELGHVVHGLWGEWPVLPDNGRSEYEAIADHLGTAMIYRDEAMLAYFWSLCSSGRVWDEDWSKMYEQFEPSWAEDNEQSALWWSTV